MTSKRRGWIKFVLVELVLLLLILIIARPQVGSRIATNKEREGIETIIALDISNSMTGRRRCSFTFREEQIAC